MVTGEIALDAIDTLRFSSFFEADEGEINIDGGTLILDGDANIDEDVAISITNGGVIRGFGTINAELNGNNADAGNEKVLADNGLLKIVGNFANGEIALGTADDDGIVEVISAWSTSAAQSVDLAGGELRGGDITIEGKALQGAGLISARVINNRLIHAYRGEPLIVETSGNNNDWDGTTGDGELSAVVGSLLEIRDDADFSFTGTLSLGHVSEIFANGFALEFEPDSLVAMGQESRYRSTHATQFGGMMTIGSVRGTLEIADSVEFESTSTTTLTGNLMLETPLTMVRPGAEFSGGGAVINPAGRTLRLLDGITSADFAAPVINRGTLQLGFTLGQVQLTDFEQTTTGVWELQMGGVGITNFDRLSLAGTAVLDGTLQLSLVSGYVPALGQALGILSAAGGVFGTFDAVLQPANMPPGLQFAIVYDLSLVQLQVVSVPTFSADFDDDGDVDGDDLAQWQDDFGLNADSDADNDGDSDGADFLAWQQQLGAGSAPALPVRAGSSVAPPAAVSEPASGLLVIALLAAGAFIHGRAGRGQISNACQ
jgi:hypothetical protein